MSAPDAYRHPSPTVSVTNRCWPPAAFRFTWLALEKLVEHSCIPMAKYGVRTLDIGTGPGSSAFAVHDFFSSMTEFSNETGNLKWRRPPQITCVELDSTTNHYRHLLAEIVFVQSQQSLTGVLGICNALPDFQKIRPTQQRKDLLNSLRQEEDEHFDEVIGERTSVLRYLPDEANSIAQSLHRYRLFTFSNFLTTVETIETYRRTLFDILEDAYPGSVIMILGGKEKQYPQIYQRMGKIAKRAGFRPTVATHEVSSRTSVVAHRVYEEGKRFYEHLQSLAQNPSDDSVTRRVCSYFEGEHRSVSSSRLIAYKKLGNRRSC